MRNQIYCIYNLNLPDGRPVQVGYCPKWAFSQELNHRADHFEFRGAGISSTGYWSQFTLADADYSPSNNEIMDYIYKLIEEGTGKKYGGINQLSLI